MEQKRPTMPVPAAGKKYYGLGRNASYAAAKRGDIPTINIGGRIFAIVPLIERQLGLLSDDQAPGSLSDGARKSAPSPTDFAHRQRDGPEAPIVVLFIPKEAMRTRVLRYTQVLLLNPRIVLHRNTSVYTMNNEI